MIGAFIDGRLVMGITKFDQNYKDMYENSGSSDVVTEEVCHKKVCKMIDTIRAENPLKIDISRVVVTPLCGKWALISRQLQMAIESGEDHKVDDLKQKAAKCLKYDPKLQDYLTCGQDQRQKDAIMKMLPEEMVVRLNEASGITALTERYKILCIRCMWR